MGVDNSDAGRTIAESGFSGAEIGSLMNKIDLLKYLLAVVLAAVFSIALFTVDATSYHNAANQVDIVKAVGTFVGLWGAFTAAIKMNPPGESK